MFSVLADLTIVTNAASSRGAWQALYGRDTANTAITLLQNLIMRQLADGGSLLGHLTALHNNWMRPRDRTLKGNTKIAKTLQALTACNETKAGYLLPPSVGNVVDNLQTNASEPNFST